MKVLSPKTRRHLEALFEVGDRGAAEQALLGWSEDSERLRFAALRVSHGDLQALDKAVALGRDDWRDLLISAGFAYDTREHERWVPRRLTPALVDRWRAGEIVDGVEFVVGSLVQVRRGELLGPVGRVETLDRLEPQPSYTIRLEGGRLLAVREDTLRPAD